MFSLNFGIVWILLGRPGIHLVDFEVNLNEWEATSQGLGRSSIHLVDFEVNLNEWEATSQGLGRPSIHLLDFEVNLNEWYTPKTNVFLLFSLNFGIIWILI